MSVESHLGNISVPEPVLFRNIYITTSGTSFHCATHVSRRAGLNYLICTKITREMNRHGSIQICEIICSAFNAINATHSYKQH